VDCQPPWPRSSVSTSRGDLTYETGPSFKSHVPKYQVCTKEASILRPVSILTNKDDTILTKKASCLFGTVSETMSNDSKIKSSPKI
jgi:hypothetical protein